MKGYTSAVIFYILLKFNFCIAKYERGHFNAAEGHIEVPCNTDEQCKDMQLKGYTCVQNMCICDDNTKCEDLKSKTTVTKIGHSCSDSHRCVAEQSFCNDTGKCDCIANTVMSRDKRKCLNVTEKIELPCEEEMQCAHLNGRCLANVCKCATLDMKVRNGKCYNSTEHCQTNEECPHFSKCKDGICVCSKKYVKSTDSDECLLKAKDLTSTCTEDIQCTSGLGSDSKCSNGVCSCMDHFHFEASTSKCVADESTSSTIKRRRCNYNNDCLLPGQDESRFECAQGVCKCESIYYEIDGECLSSENGANGISLRIVIPFVVSYVIFYVIV